MLAASSATGRILEYISVILVLVFWCQFSVWVDSYNLVLQHNSGLIYTFHPIQTPTGHRPM